MELKITAKNLNVSDRFRDYVSEKAGKVEHYSHSPQELIIKVTRHDHSKHAGVEDQVEITVYEPGHVVRAEAPGFRQTLASQHSLGPRTTQRSSRICSTLAITPSRALVCQCV